jgi:hypothetical protein
MAYKEAVDQGTFLSVLADGKFHMTVDEGTEGARKRVYKTSTGEEGFKWEKVITEVSGLISKVEFHEGDYGKNLNITITDGEDEPLIISLATAQPFGEDMMKKLLAVNMDLPVKLVPYSFIDDKGKTRKGMSVYQNFFIGEDGKPQGDKLKSYFQEGEGKETKNINGYPDAPKAKAGKTISTDEWKMYFMQARLFMIEKITETLKLEDTDWSQDASYDPVTGAAKKGDF